MTNYPLEELIEGCCRQHRGAQQAFYERFYGYALSVCLSYAGTQEDAAEILNDGFMKVFQGLSTLKAEEALLPWLRRIMVNTALDHYRKHRHRLADLPTEAVEAYLIEPNLGETSIYAHLSAQEIIQALHCLPTLYRVVFSLHVLEGYTHQEIAAQLSIAEGSSRAYLTQANRLLRRRLTEQSTRRYDRI